MSRERITPEAEAAFTDFIKRNEIKGICFDLDDTLIKTHQVFERHEELFLEYCKNYIPESGFKEFEENYHRVNNASFVVLGASQNKWQYIVEQLVIQYQIPELVNGVDILNEIYLSAPEIFDGSLEVLNLCKKAGLKLGLVTHGKKAWTDIKLNGELGSYFDHIEIIDVDEHKFKEGKHWQAAFDKLGIEAENMVVVGDNLKGDILAACSCGVKHLVKMPSKWSVYAAGEMQNEIIQINQISDLVDALATKN